MGHSTSVSNDNDKQAKGQAPFSAEVPALLQHHLEHLKASGISNEVIHERGYRSVLGKTPLKEAGFSTRQQRPPGILIPLHGVDGSLLPPQYKPDYPRKDAKRERPIKYENSLGSSIRLDIPPRCQGQLGDPIIPIWFTEGGKKADALATQGACAVNLSSVWGFKGRNALGGVTILADFDYIALAEREAYICYDSDYADNPWVRLAAERLEELLNRKRAKVRLIYLPPGPQGEKVGVDDFITAGHTLDDLLALAGEEPPTPPPRKVHQVYIVEDGIICWKKPTPSGEVLTPLCNFDARAIEDVIKDSGIEQMRFFVIEGSLASGKALPRVQLQANHFNSMNWVSEQWGMGAIIAAGVTLKDRLREAIQLKSGDIAQRRVYTHTGWRELDGKPVFLTANGALGLPGVEVELDPPLQRYQLPLEATGDIKEVIKASLDFLNIGEAKIMIPLWAAMYLAPLSQVLDPAFTLWQVGPTGTFKSTIQALALSHFGTFTVRSLPASWRATTNYLEKLMALAKDIPLVVDDWAPPPDTKQAREYETKAEQVGRAQGNRGGRGRLRSDTSTRPVYVPRGVVVTNGEQLPSGQSHTARLFSTELEPSDINVEKLTAAQGVAHLYPFCMAAYISWLAAQWPTVEKKLPAAWDQWRHQAQIQGQHPRVPEAVAWLYAGFDMAVAFAEEAGVIDHSQAQQRRDWAWDILIELGDAQGGRVEEERPGRRFLEGLKALMDEGRVIFTHKDEEPTKVSPFETQIGWRGEEGFLYLNPYPAYSVVYDFCRRAGEPLTFKTHAVWKDLRRMGLTFCDDGRTSTTARISGKSRRVIALKVKALQDV